MLSGMYFSLTQCQFIQMSLWTCAIKLPSDQSDPPGDIGRYISGPSYLSVAFMTLVFMLAVRVGCLVSQLHSLFNVVFHVLIASIMGFSCIIITLLPM